ncbi:uncharacterized protein LOC128713114 [Anopheles marshallii]|uniref:uncharacterized protein LOC128713114 n=1 Tax=Anopheles marshallii TaxID=1521116 RepID=UPI00237A62D5|nr:uncharacterized protein LOC128713114 [Anopheles marshallii]
MLYGHSTGLQQGPYPPYPVMFLPGPPAAGEQSPYLPLLAYGGVAGDNNHLPTVIGWPEPTPFAPLAPAATEVTIGSTGQPTTARTAAVSNSKPPNTPPQVEQSAAKSAYLLKLNLTPAEESELKRLAKLLGVTDFEHLPPFEDVKALLGTSTSGETIKAIKEYAATPDGLELIKDYVMSYQPAKRISLGKEPYVGNEVAPVEASTATETAASSLSSGFFAHLRRLKSLLTFGYFDANGDETPAESALEVATPEVASEAPFTPNEYPGFEIRDVRGSASPLPVAHYLIPVRTLPRHSSPGELKYASALPFPYAVHYPAVVPQLHDSNPFTVLKEPASLPSVPDVSHLVASDPSIANEPSPSDVILPKRIAPPTLATGEVHSFERADIEQPVRTTTPAGQQHELTVSTVTSTVVDHEEALADIAELANDTTNFVLNVLDTEQTA